MYMECCNPDCDARFDYREGQLIRVSKIPSMGGSGEKRRTTEHFWLCGRCAGRYVLEHKSGMAVTIRRRDGDVPRSLESGSFPIA